MLATESTSSHTGQVTIDEDSEEAIFAVQITGSPAVKGNGILYTPVSPRLAHSSSFLPFRSSDPPPSFTSARVDDGILPTLRFSTRLPSLLPSGAWVLFPCARVRLNRLFLGPLFVRHPRPLGRIPFPFLPCPLPNFLHLLFIHLLSSRLFLFLPPHPYHPCLCFLHHFTLFFFTFVKSHNVLCHVLS